MSIYQRIMDFGKEALAVGGLIAVLSGCDPVGGIRVVGTVEDGRSCGKGCYDVTLGSLPYCDNAVFCDNASNKDIGICDNGVIVRFLEKNGFYLDNIAREMKPGYLKSIKIDSGWGCSFTANRSDFRSVRR